MYHPIGGSLQGAILEVMRPTASLLAAGRRLAAALGLGGIVVIPLAALGGRFGSRSERLRPVDRSGDADPRA